MSFIITILSGLYALLHDGRSLEKETFGAPFKEIFNLSNISYEIETRNVRYVIKGRFFWVPKTYAYGILVHGKVFHRKENRYIELGTREYPLLVPKILQESRIAHIVARRRYVFDTSYHMDKTENGV